MGQRQGRQGVPRRDGQQARRGHLQHGRRGGVPLEGLGAERGGDPHLVRRRGRQRPAALVHQVRRRAPRPPLARASSRTSTAGTTAPSATCGTRSRSPGWAWSTRSRPPGSTAARGRRRRSRTTRSGGTRRSSRPGSRSRWSTTGSSTRPTWRRLKTLILPNIAALSDEQCRQLRAFVERGGGLVATYETSLYDERGERRADFGLADLFGVSFRRRADGPMRNAYLRLEADPRTGRRHPLLAGLDDAPRVIHGTWRLEVTPTDRVRGPAADAHPELPRPADGDGLSARPEDRHRRGVPARGRRRPGRLLPLGHRPRLLGGPGRRPRPAARERRAVGDGRGAAGRGRGPRRARRDRLAAGRAR